MSDLLKHALTKHKKGKETSVNPEEDQSVEDHGESLKFDRLNNYMYITTQNAGFLLSGFSRIWTESYPNFSVYGQNVRVCPYMGKKGYNSVHIRENTDERACVLAQCYAEVFLPDFQPKSKYCQIQRGLCY